MVVKRDGVLFRSSGLWHLDEPKRLRNSQHAGVDIALQRIVSEEDPVQERQYRRRIDETMQQFPAFPEFAYGGVIARDGKRRKDQHREPARKHARFDTL